MKMGKGKRDVEEAEKGRIYEVLKYFTDFKAFGNVMKYIFLKRRNCRRNREILS